MLDEKIIILNTPQLHGEWQRPSYGDFFWDNIEFDEEEEERERQSYDRDRTYLDSA